MNLNHHWPLLTTMNYESLLTIDFTIDLTIDFTIDLTIGLTITTSIHRNPWTPPSIPRFGRQVSLTPFRRSSYAAAEIAFDGGTSPCPAPGRRWWCPAHEIRWNDPWNRRFEDSYSNFSATIAMFSCFRSWFEIVQDILFGFGAGDRVFGSKHSKNEGMFMM